MTAEADSAVRMAHFRRQNILNEVRHERRRQDAKWGEQNHPDVDPVLTGRAGGCRPSRMAEEYGVPMASRAKAECDGAAKAGQCTWAHILVEEVAEAIEAGCESQQGRAPVSTLRDELVQIAAVATAWIEAIDRRDER